MRPSGPNAEEGQQAFDQNREKRTLPFPFSFLIFQMHFKYKFD
jgi:hypothetical protein